MQGASGGTFALVRGGLHWRPSAPYLRQCQWPAPRIAQHNPIQSVLSWHCHRNFEAVTWHSSRHCVTSEWTHLSPGWSVHSAQASKPATKVQERAEVPYSTPTGTSALTIGMGPMAATRISQHSWYLKAEWSTLAFSGVANAKAQS